MNDIPAAYRTVSGVNGPLVILDDVKVSGNSTNWLWAT